LKSAGSGASRVEVQGVTDMLVYGLMAVTEDNNFSNGLARQACCARNVMENMLEHKGPFAEIERLLLGKVVRQVHVDVSDDSFNGGDDLEFGYHIPTPDISCM
jgi:hypothetical protein